MVSRITAIPRYICCSLVTKRAIFMFVDSSIRPSNLLQVFAFADDFTFGVLQSHLHWLWFTSKCSKLKTDFRFGEQVWNTFPWPQSPEVERVDEVAAALAQLFAVRRNALKTVAGGLRAIYRTLEFPGDNPLKDAHEVLNRAVLSAYGFSAKSDLLEQLLRLNGNVAARIATGQPVLGPGVPPNYPNPAALVSDDCIRPS